MKGPITLAFLCLLACSGSSSGSHHNLSKTSDSFVQQFRKESRDSSDSSCSLTCTGSGNSWIIEIEVGVYIAYNAEYNFFAIYNVKLSKVVIFNGKSGIFVILNVKVGGGIIVNASTWVSAYIKTGIITEFNSTSTIFLGITKAYQISLSYSSQVQGDVNVNIGFSFSLTVLVEGLGEGKDISVIFQGRDELIVALKGSFSVIFSQIKSTITILASKGICVGVAIIIAPVLNITASSKVIVEAVLKFAASVVVDLGVKFSASLFAAFQSSLQLSIGVAAKAVLKLVDAIELAGKVYANLEAAVQGFVSNTLPTIIRTSVKLLGKLYAVVASKVESGWFFQITFSGSVDYTVGIYWSTSTNAIGFFNKQKHLAIIFVDSKYAVYSLKTGYGIVTKSIYIVNVSGSASTIVELSASGNFAGALAAAAKEVSSTRIGLGSTLISGVIIRVKGGGSFGTNLEVLDKSFRASGSISTYSFVNAVFDGLGITGLSTTITTIAVFLVKIGHISASIAGKLFDALIASVKSNFQISVSFTH